MKKLIFFITIITLKNLLFSQAEIYNNAVLSIQDSVKIYAGSDFINFENAKIQNDGNIVLMSDWYNYSQDLFMDEKGLVSFYGDNQSVKGDKSTNFFEIEFDDKVGYFNASIDMEIKGKLNIKNKIIEISNAKFYLQNTESENLKWENGFFHCNDLSSYLVRATNSNKEYLFPVGSELLYNNYRAVSVFPYDTTLSQFAVRLSDIDPRNDIEGITIQNLNGPFDILNKSRILSKLNNNFYHNILSLNEKDAKIDVYYHETDGRFNTMGQWNYNNYWDTTDFSNSIILDTNSKIGFPNRISSVLKINKSQSEIFTLAERQIEYVVNQFLSINGDGENDFLEIKEYQYFNNITIEIFNRWGNLVYKNLNYKNDFEGKSNINNKNSFLPEGTYFYVVDADGIKESGFIEITK